MSLSEVLARNESTRLLQIVAERYRTPLDQAQLAAEQVRPVILRQIEACLESPNGPTELLHMLAEPAFLRIEEHPQAVVEQETRLIGDAIHRQLSHHDQDMWMTLDRIAPVSYTHLTLPTKA